MKAPRSAAAALALCVLGSIILFGSGPGKRPGIGVQSPPVQGAIVWYLGHCGYAVRTKNHLLVFDYQERRDGQQPKSRPEKPALDNGWIDPEEIKGLKVRVFVSHSHDDHFDPAIFRWKAVVADIAYFFGWKVSDDPSLHILAGPRSELRSGGLEITTINSHHSGVPEVAWLVEVDGLVVYHNGDCQPGDPAAEHDFLRTKTDAIDLAFVPPIFAEREKYGRQNQDLLKKFRVRAVFPMHVQAGGKMYLDFERDVRTRLPSVPVRVPMSMGQRFTYADGTIED